ncbi:MAG: acylphosphatase [Rhodocyclaceae bacterium]|nr:acylphosphatase [Rhodocyclaceae bacterium]
MPATVCASATVCRRIRVRGQVQGVGFRPFVYRLAQELNIAGWVRNDGEGVDIEAQGAAKMLEAFIARLETEAPPLASVTAVERPRRRRATRAASRSKSAATARRTPR